MASIEEIPSRPRPVVRLVQVPVPVPRRPSRLISMLASLTVQTVILFVALVVFAVGVTSITLRVGQLSAATQRQQDELVLWRYDTNRVSLAAEELRTNLAEMNDSLLSGGSGSAAADLSLAQTNIRFIESELSTISALNLPADSVADNTQAGVAFRALTDTARQFIAAAPNPNQDEMVQLDGALLKS